MIIMQLTDRHPLSNCPQLLQPTRSPELVRRSNLNCYFTIWSNIWPRCNYRTRDYSCFFYLTATYRTRWRHRRVLTFTSWCSSIQPQVQRRYRFQSDSILMFYHSPTKHLTGAATLGAIGVALLLVTKAVKRSEKEKKPFKK